MLRADCLDEVELIRERLNSLGAEDLGEDENLVRASLLCLYAEVCDQSSSFPATGLGEDTLQHVILSCMPTVQGSPNWV